MVYFIKRLKSTHWKIHFKKQHQFSTKQIFLDFLKFNYKASKIKR